MIDLSTLGLTNYGWIHDQKLARAAQPSAESYDRIHEAGFHGIIDLRAEAHLAVPMTFYTPTPGDGAGRSVVPLPTADHAALSADDITRARGFLADPRHIPCLIYCGKGSGRTGELAAMIRLLDDDWPMDAIKAEAMRYRVPQWWFRPLFFFSDGRLGWLDQKQIKDVEAAAREKQR